MLTWAQVYANTRAQWIQEIEAQVALAKGGNGDRYAQWLMLRGWAESASVGTQQLEASLPYLTQALQSATSPALKTQIVRASLETEVQFGQYEAALRRLDGLAGPPAAIPAPDLQALRQALTKARDQSAVELSR